MRFKLILLILLFINLWSKPALACGNFYGHNLQGEIVFSPDIYLSATMLSFDKDWLWSQKKELEEKIKRKPQNFQFKSDLSLVLMQLGMTDSALSILRPLIKLYPTEYNVVANLGTAFELKGKLDSALILIRKGYELNPLSHRGSEWIHIKILEAKIKAKRSNPTWMQRNAIITMEELEQRLGEGELKAEQVNLDFNYQIRTRVPFTPAPNAVLSNLFETLGDFNEKYGTYEQALLAYAYSMKFSSNPNYNENIRRKIKNLNRQLHENKGEHDLSPEFHSMLIRSEVDPMLLVLGLDDYADHLDSIYLRNQSFDSLKIAKMQLDSIAKAVEEKDRLADEKIRNQENHSYLYLLGGLALGLLVGILVRQLAKRKAQ
ncbi:tetratricopeptide repeat protein [Croceimicrobium sp.]|uniref:tetratricopeptide repeat protein n=1 Tax=Croceimicrobium sp. TaxID=2828340 RepID=UPI003BA84A5A